MDRYRIEFERMDWVSPVEGVRHRVHPTGDQRLRLVEYTPAMKPHWCNRGHLGCVLEGRFEIEFDDGIRIYEPGDGVCIPSGEEHRHRARALTRVVRCLFVEDS